MRPMGHAWESVKLVLFDRERVQWRTFAGEASIAFRIGLIERIREKIEHPRMKPCPPIPLRSMKIDCIYLFGQCDSMWNGRIGEAPDPIPPDLFLRYVDATRLL